jgi:O-succinylbenzoate synthase
LIIQSIELREICLPLIHFFETSFGRTTERRIVLARVTDADGAEGWGECTAGEEPFYSDEWTDSVWSTLGEFLGPMVIGQRVDRASDVFGLMRPVRGHRMAKATIETAWRAFVETSRRHASRDLVRSFDRHSGHT